MNQIIKLIRDKKCYIWILETSVRSNTPDIPSFHHTWEGDAKNQLVNNNMTQYPINDTFTSSVFHNIAKQKNSHHVLYIDIYSICPVPSNTVISGHLTDCVGFVYVCVFVPI